MHRARPSVCYCNGGDGSDQPGRRGARAVVLLRDAQSRELSGYAGRRWSDARAKRGSSEWERAEKQSGGQGEEATRRAVQGKATRLLRESGWGTVGEGKEGKGDRRMWFKNGKTPFIKPSRHVPFEGEKRAASGVRTSEGSGVVTASSDVRQAQPFATWVLRQCVISHCKCRNTRAL